MSIVAGELNRIIQLQSVTYAASAEGERTPTWITYGNAWAKIEPLSGREIERAKSFGSSVSVRITLRYRTDVATSHRALYGDHTYLINAVLAPDEKHDATMLFATEITA